jgi:hypothetical protein
VREGRGFPCLYSQAGSKTGDTVSWKGRQGLRNSEGVSNILFTCFHSCSLSSSVCYPLIYNTCSAFQPLHNPHRNPTSCRIKLSSAQLLPSTISQSRVSVHPSISYVQETKKQKKSEDRRYTLPESQFRS